MSGSLLHENAMQIVPVLLISLFIDRRAAGDASGLRAQRWLKLQNKVIALLSFVAFFTSMFVVAGVAHSGVVTDAIVIAALGGSIGLLFGLIWIRFNDGPTSPSS